MKCVVNALSKRSTADKRTQGVLGGVVALLAGVVLVMIAAGPGSANAGACREVGGGIVCSGQGGAGGSAGRGAPNGQHPLRIWTVVDGPDGPCQTSFIRWLDRPPTAAEERMAVEAFGGFAGLYPACPPGQGAISPVQWVSNYVSEHGPAAPQPRISAGRSVVGLRSWLVTEVEASWSDRVADTPFGPLTLSGTAVIRVDWGDGTTSVHRVRGQEFPEGEITHVYTEVADRDIEVSYDWTVDWRFGVARGELRPQLTGRIEGLEVTEVEAVLRTVGRSG